MPEPRGPAGAQASGLRVLIVLGASTGGIGRHVRDLAEGLAPRGVAVTVVCPAATARRLELERLPRLRLVTAPVGAGAPGAVLAARRVLGRQATSADVVHAHGLRAGAACAASVPRSRLVVTWHNAPLGGALQRRTHAALARYVARSAAVTLAASDDLAAQARAAGAPDVRTTFVAAPSLPPPRRAPGELRAELGLPDGPVVLAVGRLHPQKRLDVLVEAAARWVGGPRAPTVLVAGEGPTRAELEALIASTRAPVRLLGDRDDVEELMAIADVVALPSEWEARSLVAQEALRAGVPLVTTPVGGLPALLGEAAVFVPVGDATRLGDAVSDLLADAEQRSRLAALGRDQARAWPTMAGELDDLVDLYLNLM